MAGAISGNGDGVMAHAPLSSRIKLIRVSLDLTQAQFGAAIGFSRQAVNAWEKGKAEPTVCALAGMRRTWGGDARWLLLGDAEEGDRTNGRSSAVTFAPVTANSDKQEGLPCSR